MVLYMTQDSQHQLLEDGGTMSSSFQSKEINLEREINDLPETGDSAQERGKEKSEDKSCASDSE